MYGDESDQEKQLSKGRKFVNDKCGNKKYFPFYAVIIGYGILVGLIYAICAAVSTETTIYRWISPSIENLIVSNGDVNLITEFMNGENCYEKAIENPDCFCAERKYDRNLNSTCKLYNNACVLTGPSTIDGFLTIYEKVVYKTANIYPTNDYFN